MKSSYDQLARNLRSELGTDTVIDERNRLDDFAVDGRQPSLFCAPETPEQVTAALRICTEAEAAVVPRGGGTAMSIGNPPQRLDVVLGLNRLNRLIEHDDANLTVAMQTGMTLKTVQEIVACRNQFLPFDPPQSTRATVGGVVAANLNGPRRTYYGAVRDLVIGMKVVLASGEQIKAGGKVVKNVAGYDLCKLFVGSLGTLGIITEVTLRLMPIAESAATLIAGGDRQQTTALADELAHSQLLAAALVMVNARAHKITMIKPCDWQIAVRFEGFKESIARLLNDTQIMAQRIGLTSEILRDQGHSQLWDKICDFPLEPDRLVYRVTVPRVSVAKVIDFICACESQDFAPAIASDIQSGTLWMAALANKTSLEQFGNLARISREQRGHTTLFNAPPSWKKGVDVWGFSSPTLSLMREIKRQFDPRSLLNPGRFVAGI